MAEKLDYTIQIDTTEYDITAADSLHADLANQVEKALIVKKSVRKDLDDIKNNLSLIIDTEPNKNNLRADIGTPSEAIGVDTDAEGNPKLDNKGNPIPIDRNAANAFAFKGDSKAEIEIVPSSGGVFTGPIYAPDINAGDGFNVNKFQVTNYNSVDTIIRELKGFPVYKWTGTHVLALTEGAPPTMLPFKVIIYTGPTSGDTTDYWTEAHRADLKLVNGNPDGTTTDCTTDGKFFLINAKDGHPDYGRILLGTFDHTKKTNCSTYEELRVKEADHADNADTLGNGKTGSSAIKPIYLDSTGTAQVCQQYAGGTKVTLNNSDKGAQNASFYAPTKCGTEGQVLLSGGSTTDEESEVTTYKAPVWKPQTTLHVGSAADVTATIDGVSLGAIFEYTDSGNDNKFVPGTDKIKAIVKNATNAVNATHATNADNATHATHATNADNATNAANAAISDKLFIYPVGGTSSSPSVGTPVASGNYIYYGENMPNNNAGTDDFRRTGNIYIKIES